MWSSVLLLCLSVGFATAYNNGVGRLPAMGWNTWCTQASCHQPHATGLLHDICYEKMVKEAATAMLDNGMHKLGFNRINLDDCWAAETRDKNGNLQPDPKRFPKGIKELTDWLHSRGLLFGLYTSAGTETCASGGRQHPPPGSYGHYKADAETFASWGVDYVKIDWCGGELNNSTKQHTEFSNAMNETGRHMWLELCRGYPHPPPPYTREVAQSWRATGDHHDVWSSTAGIIEAFAGLSKRGGPYGWNYGDFLMTGGAGCDQPYPYHCPGQTDAEYMTEFSIWAITASPLIVATDIRNMTDVMKKVLLNDEIIAVNQDTAPVPGDRIGYWRCSEKDVCEQWVRELADGSYGVVLYNKSDMQSHSISIEFSSLGWGGATGVVRDLWAHKDLGKFPNAFSTPEPLKPHHSMFLRIAFE
eukprot:TRINITY_DN67478_c3_g19_i1.p1 TRINITY_DN67478_c3_g19~~TRINITY_DN67478_c3_g19_i1.p1  ORF type:complete len:416 (+),score=48.85 TRINITY_DN67478_c3_g19_i1:34-1281(+)